MSHSDELDMLLAQAAERAKRMKFDAKRLTDAGKEYTHMNYRRSTEDRIASLRAVLAETRP